MKRKRRRRKKKKGNLQLSLTILILILQLVGFNQKVCKYVGGLPIIKRIGINLCVDGIKYKIGKVVR